MSRPAYVYAALAGGTCIVKVGKSIDPEERVRLIRQGTRQLVVPEGVNRAGLTLIRSWRGNRDMERWFHSQLRLSHIGGEWFDFVDLDPGRLLDEVYAGRPARFRKTTWEI